MTGQQQAQREKQRHVGDEIEVQPAGVPMSGRDRPLDGVPMRVSGEVAQRKYARGKDHGDPSRQREVGSIVFPETRDK